MNTHCYTVVTADPCLIIVTQDITSQVHIFASHHVKGKTPVTWFSSTHTSKRYVKNPGNSVVTQFNFPARPPVLLMLNFKVLGINF